MLNKYIKNYIQYKISKLFAGKKNYYEWKKYNYSLKEAKIENKKLAKDLEDECDKNDGFLTFAQYLEIDQFGNNGYHAKHTDNGNTDSYKIWKNALPVLCKKYDYKNVIDMGAGNGELGVEMLKYAKNNNINLTWSSIEKNIKLHKIIRDNFKKEKLTTFLAKIEDDIHKIPLKEKCLIVFSYSLDSIAPEIFVNTTKNVNFPNTIIGVTVKNGVLREIYLSKEQLQNRQISFENGIYQDQNRLNFNLKNWLIHPGQRAFIPIAGYNFLANIIEHIPEKSLTLIIDELNPPPENFETNHLCIPKDLDTYTRDIYDFKKLYKTSGQNLLYFTSYLSEYISVLRSLGLTELKWGKEKLMSKAIMENNLSTYNHGLNYKCFCLMGIKTKKINKEIILPGPWKAHF